MVWVCGLLHLSSVSVCVCVCVFFVCVCACVFSQPAGSGQVRLVRPCPQDEQPTTAVASVQPGDHRCDDTDSPPRPAPGQPQHPQPMEFRQSAGALCLGADHPMGTCAYSVCVCVCVFGACVNVCVCVFGECVNVCVCIWCVCECVCVFGACVNVCVCVYLVRV